jgi:hypothetical protein
MRLPRAALVPGRSTATSPPPYHHHSTGGSEEGRTSSGWAGRIDYGGPVRPGGFGPYLATPLPQAHTPYYQKVCGATAFQTLYATVGRT